MKVYWGVEVYFHSFLTSELDGGEWSASCRGRFPLREKAPGAHWIRRWVGPRAGPGALMRNIPSTRRDSKPKTSIVQPVA
jgi:hypothetical protein